MAPHTPPPSDATRGTRLAPRPPGPSRRFRAAWIVPGLLVVATVAAGFLAADVWLATPVVPLAPPAATAIVDARAADALTREALALYAKADFAAACDRFGQAAGGGPSDVRREGVGRCFEGWGWQALDEGRALEAMALFRQGLREHPAAPGLLRGLGLSAVRVGRADEALAPLEEAVRAAADSDVRLLLAHLWDRRDDPERAAAHVRAILAAEPGHERARRLLAKLEREAEIEAEFARSDGPHFIVKAPPDMDAALRERVTRQLEGARERVHAALGVVLADRPTVVLYAAGDFRRVTGLHGWASGAFDGKIRLPLATSVPPPHELERLVLHEYAHAVIHHVSHGRAPRWLQEGLAQVLEGSTVDPMLRVPGQPTLAGIEALVMDADPARARTGYDLALWVVSDLAARGGMPRMRALLERLGAGEQLGEAMTRVYGLRASELEAHWRRVLGG
jgi:tetratricopeptide (TPR) repeat protein